MIVAIGSTNRAKVQALKEILTDSSIFSKAELISIETSSEVSDQPLSFQETILGAKNRATNAFHKCKSCTYGFGIESGLMEVSEVSTGFLHVSICSIYDGKNYYTGLSSGFELPSQILNLLLEQKMDLSKACLYSGISHNTEIGSTEGLVGILSKGKMDRKDYSKQCITTAIFQLENAKWYIQLPTNAIP